MFGLTKDQLDQLKSRVREIGAENKAFETVLGSTDNQTQCQPGTKAKEGEKKSG